MSASTIVPHLHSCHHGSVRESPVTFVLYWGVSITAIVLDVVSALGTHASVTDVWSYGQSVLEIPWERAQVGSEMELLLSEGRLGHGS